MITLQETHLASGARIRNEQKEVAQLPLTVNPAMQRKGTPHPAMQRRKGLIPSGASLAGCAPVPLPLLRHSTSRRSRDVCETAGPSKKRAPRDSDYMSDDDCFDGWLSSLDFSRNSGYTRRFCNNYASAATSCLV